jgi:hypothetical protein
MIESWTVALALIGPELSTAEPGFGDPDLLKAVDIEFSESVKKADAEFSELATRPTLAKRMVAATMTDWHSTEGLSNPEGCPGPAVFARAALAEGESDLASAVFCHSTEATKPIELPEVSDAAIPALSLTSLAPDCG